VWAVVVMVYRMNRICRIYKIRTGSVTMRANPHEEKFR